MAPSKRSRPQRGSRKTIDVIRRAAVIYRVLIEQEETTRDELIARVREALGPEAYGTAPEDAFRRDVQWLRDLGYEVLPDEKHRYRLSGCAPLLPLPLTPEQVAAFAVVKFLENQPDTVGQQELQDGIRQVAQHQIQMLSSREAHPSIETGGLGGVQL